ncbi:MAG: L,D-transpeptidase [Rhizobiaceae bacterium]|nr:L,D-transpeptidase [Rhizobiaceae bacterium]
MKRFLPLLAAALLAAGISGAQANDRYRERPPLVVSPDLSAPWVLQLQRAPQGARVSGLRGVRVTPAPRQVIRRERRETTRAAPRETARQAEPMVQMAAAAPAQARSAGPQMDPMFLPQTVNYSGPHKPGTIVIETASKFLYLVQEGGQARRYGVGVGKEGFLWHGTETISQKREWPDWRPPAEMIEREKRKGRILPAFMPGGPGNPLGARALYLGSTLYRIHGTNAPWTIGGNVSSGCIRMRNEDVTDLYERVGVGTKVVVI